MIYYVQYNYVRNYIIYIKIQYDYKSENKSEKNTKKIMNVLKGLGKI